MFNNRQVWEQEFRNNDNKITELIDILSDYDFLYYKNRGSFKTNAGFIVYERNWNGPLVDYNSNNQEFIIKIPDRPYEYQSVGIKAVKTVDNGRIYGIYRHFIMYCSLSSNSTHRITFDSKNLNEGMELLPLNGAQRFTIWFEIADRQNRYTIETLSRLFDNLVIEFDFIIRK